jgi:peptidoglycan L-alanyl-D-glutamate endopeptidase CwlK
VFKKYGWEWGGDWTSFKDYPHFQKTFGKSIPILLTLVNSNKVDREGYVLI